MLPWKSSKYYILVCVCALACVHVGTRGRGLVNIKCVFGFLCNVCINISHPKNNLARYRLNVEMSPCKVLVIFRRILMKLNVLDRFSRKSKISSVIKIRRVGAEVFHEEANSRFSQFCDRSYKALHCLPSGVSCHQFLAPTQY